MVYKYSILKALLLSYIYYCIIYTFPYGSQLSPNMFISDNLNSFIPFFLLYLFFINNFQMFFANSMFLVRNKSLSNSVLGILKELVPLNILYTFIFVFVINIVNIQHFGKVDLIYSVKFFMLINLCFIFLNLVVIIPRIIWGGISSFISALFFIMLSIFSILFKKESDDFLFLPLSLHAMPLNTFKDFLIVISIFSLYICLIFLFIFFVRRLYYGNQKHIS